MLRVPSNLSRQEFESLKIQEMTFVAYRNEVYPSRYDVFFEEHAVIVVLEGEKKLSITCREVPRCSRFPKAGSWFGSRPVAGAAYSLMGCTVAPGFDFADFELAEREKLLVEFPQHPAMVEGLT